LVRIYRNWYFVCRLPAGNTLLILGICSLARRRTIRLRFGLQPQDLLLCRIWSLPSKATRYRWQYCLFVGGWDDCIPQTRSGGGGHGRYALGRSHGGFGDTGCHVEWLVHVLLWWRELLFGHTNGSRSVSIGHRFHLLLLYRHSCFFRNLPTGKIFLQVS
jgi:hypothetical protein